MNTAELLELRLLRDEVAELRALMLRLVPPAPPGHQALLQALAATFHGPFTSGEVIGVASVSLSTREPLRDALAALGIRDAHKLGMQLGTMVNATRSQALRLVRTKKEGGAVLWRVECAR